MGLLCIVSDADGLIENILNEKTGWVVPKRNPILLAKKMKDIIELSEESKNEIRLNAIERVKKEFNLTEQKVAFDNFYKDK
jgi:colanic acid/amylovoran biosynthesis glycosyltransferase